MKQENVMLASVLSAQVASSEKGRFKYPPPRYGQSKHPTPGTIPGPAQPPPPTHLHSCLFYLFELTLCSIRSNEGYPLILGNKLMKIQHN